MNGELIIFRDTVEEILTQYVSGLCDKTEALRLIQQALIESKK